MEEANLLPSVPSIAQVVGSLITSIESLADTFPLTLNAIRASQWKTLVEGIHNVLNVINEFLEFHNKGIRDRDDINRLVEELSEEEKTALRDKSQEMFETLFSIFSDILNDPSWMKSSSQRIPSIVMYFHKLVEKLQKTEVANKLIMQGFIISLISQYDIFLGELIRALFLIKPETLNISEKNNFIKL